MISSRQALIAVSYRIFSDSHRGLLKFFQDGGKFELISYDIPMQTASLRK